MNKKLENFFILSDIFIFFYLFVLYFLEKFFPSYGILGCAGLFLLMAPLPLAIFFLISFCSLINKPINKNNNRYITIASVILFFVAFYLIFFGVGRGIGAKPLAKFTKSKSVCQMIISDFQKESCLGDVAVLREDESICILIKDHSKKDQCYWRVAEQTLDIELCKKAGWHEDICIMDVAQGTGNKKYCDYMPENNFSKDFCIRMVEN